MNDNNRTIHFGEGGIAKIKLMNSELKIHQDFDLSKDTKFSTRTLLLLCVFCIGVFGFGLSPNFFGYNLSTNYRYFVVFCLCVLIGQSFITWFQYSLNKEKLKRYLSKQEEEIDRLIHAKKEIQQKLDGFYNSKQEMLHKPFPQFIMNQQIDNPKQLNDALKPLFNEYTKQLEYANQELHNAKVFYRNSKMVYKWINGYITSGLVFIAIVLGIISLYCNNSVADVLFSHTSDLQYLSINITNMDPHCLLHN